MARRRSPKRKAKAKTPARKAYVPKPRTRALRHQEIVLASAIRAMPNTALSSNSTYTEAVGLEGEEMFKHWRRICLQHKKIPGKQGKPAQQKFLNYFTVFLTATRTLVLSDVLGVQILSPDAVGLSDLNAPCFVSLELLKHLERICEERGCDLSDLQDDIDSDDKSATQWVQDLSSVLQTEKTLTRAQMSTRYALQVHQVDIPIVSPPQEEEDGGDVEMPMDHGLEDDVDVATGGHGMDLDLDLHAPPNVNVDVNLDVDDRERSESDLDLDIQPVAGPSTHRNMAMFPETPVRRLAGPEAAYPTPGGAYPSPGSTYPTPGPAATAPSSPSAAPSTPRPVRTGPSMYWSPAAQALPHPQDALYQRDQVEVRLEEAGEKIEILGEAIQKWGGVVRVLNKEARYLDRRAAQ